MSGRIGLGYTCIQILKQKKLIDTHAYINRLDTQQQQHQQQRRQQQQQQQQRQQQQSINQSIN